MSSVMVCKFLCYLLGCDRKEWVFYYFDSTSDYICNICNSRSRFLRYKYACVKCKATFCFHHFIEHQKFQAIVLRTTNGKHIIRCKDDMLYVFKSDSISTKMAMHLHFTTLKIIENININISFCYWKIQELSLQKIEFNKSSLTKLYDLFAKTQNLVTLGNIISRP